MIERSECDDDVLIKISEYDDDVLIKRSRVWWWWCTDRNIRVWRWWWSVCDDDDILIKRSKYDDDDSVWELKYDDGADHDVTNQNVMMLPIERSKCRRCCWSKGQSAVDVAANRKV